MTEYIIYTLRMLKRKKKNPATNQTPCSGCILTTFYQEFILLLCSATDFNMTLVKVVLILGPTYNLILNKKFTCDGTTVAKQFGSMLFSVKSRKFLFLTFAVEITLLVP